MDRFMGIIRRYNRVGCLSINNRCVEQRGHVSSRGLLGSGEEAAVGGHFVVNLNPFCPANWEKMVYWLRLICRIASTAVAPMATAFYLFLAYFVMRLRHNFLDGVRRRRPIKPLAFRAVFAGSFLSIATLAIGIANAVAGAMCLNSTGPLNSCTQNCMFQAGVAAMEILMGLVLLAAVSFFRYRANNLRC